MNWDDFKSIIVDNLSDELLSSRFRKLKKRGAASTFGHCYVASETAYHLLGGKAEGWKSYFIEHENCSHWFIKHKSGLIIDFTADQFTNHIPYNKGIGKGFLTKQPSKRAKILMQRIAKSPQWQFIKMSET
jgi:hypothetical protein